ncbi:MAG: DUF1294 domain-containing protein [Phycisphaerales bacterium]|jgi:uncharacterized membrane protein YsdA (DUF1294 family)|nr:DUF1294 domain-containing protein [Phycisphaerales bacterium]
MSDRVLMVLALWYLGWSLLAFIVFGVDKRAARKGRRRVPERRLHLLELLGGFPGALLAILLFHHKSSKPRFLVVTVLAVLGNLAALFMIWYFLSRV